MKRICADWRRFLDALLGAPCVHCGERVFPRDVTTHVFVDHAGDKGCQ